MKDQTLDTCMVAVQGPKALEHVPRPDRRRRPRRRSATTTPRRRTYKGKPCVVSRTGYTGEDGLEFMVGNAPGRSSSGRTCCSRGAKPCGLGARDTLRLEAAMPLYGHELNEEIDPFQAGLGWAVKLDKGDFLGREALLQRPRGRRAAPRVSAWSWQGKRIAREGVNGAARRRARSAR